jgi:hypothetical protein
LIRNGSPAWASSLASLRVLTYSFDKRLFAVLNLAGLRAGGVSRADGDARATATKPSAS